VGVASRSFSTVSPTLSTPTTALPPATPAVQDALWQCPLLFVENQGQLPSAVAFVLPGRDTSVFFPSTGLTYRLTPAAPSSAPGVQSVALAPPPAWSPAWNLQLGPVTL
jgi:hypothetical protein